ncbi:transcription factor [Fusarium longipes]|uniref:Transcription factor n=1 Tax=Fusarium longipes TaxID=694270 RepID=A0A395T4K9_9HYPO|nr:transcription factor [Fusarium longipes]
MTTLYQQTIPVMVKYLKNFSAMLQKGAKFCEEKNLKHEEMLSYRLISDMRGLPYQVQSCSNTAKFVASRFGAENVPIFEDNEQTFEELQERIAKTVEILESVDPNLLNGKEETEILMESKMGTFRFTGQRYISEYVIPNFHFHLTSAYCIMRTQGVPLGAFDYLKDVFEKV